MTSESTSDENTWPWRSSVARSRSAFSTMPLCTMLIRPEQSACGCAFASRTTPCVAHRVCPMPTPVSASPERAATSVRRSPTRDTDRMVSVPPWAVRTAMPAESYPRYSSRSSPSSR